MQIKQLLRKLGNLYEFYVTICQQISIERLNPNIWRSLIPEVLCVSIVQVKLLQTITNYR